MEIVRIFNKKRIFILFVLFLINGLFFLRERSDLKMYEIFNRLVSEVDAKTERAVDIRKTARSVLNKYADVYKDSEEYEDYLKARQLLLEKVDYVENYTENKTQQIENSKVVLSSSLFRDKNSFSYLNIIKTTKDLERIKNEKVTLSNGIWLEKVTDYELIYYVIAVAAVMIVYSLIEDRKTGIIYLQYAAPNGRGRLFLKRLCILMGAVFAVTVLLFAEISILSLKRYGGLEGINDPVCSDELFAMCSMGGMSRITWLVINVLRIAFAVGAMGMCAWAVLTCFNNTNIGLCGFILLYGVEILFNRIITDKSIFRVFKLFNLKYLIDSRTAWFTYRNWGYSNIITDMAQSTGILITLVMGISMVLLAKNCVLCGPLNKVGVLEKALIKTYECAMKLFAKLPAAVMELFKLVVSQRIGVAIIVIVLLFANMNKGYVLKYSVVMSSISNLCTSYEGASTETLSEKRDALLQEKAKYEGDNDITAISKKNIIEAQIEHLDYVIEKRREGVNASLISPYEYEAALGKNQTANQQFIAMLCIMVMLLANIGAISYEKKNGMLYHICTAQNRMRWIRNKILYNGILAALTAMILYGWYYYDLIQLYRLTDFNASVQSLPMFANYVQDIPIWGFAALDLALKIIVLIAIGGMAFTISAIFNYDVGYFAELLIIMPYFLCELGMNIFSYISVPKIMAFMPFWLEGRAAYNLAADIIVIIIGIIGYIYGAYRIVRR